MDHVKVGKIRSSGTRNQEPYHFITMELKNDTQLTYSTMTGVFLNMPEFPLLSDDWVSDFEVFLRNFR